MQLLQRKLHLVEEVGRVVRQRWRGDVTPHPAVEKLGKVQRGHAPLQGHRITPAEQYYTQFNLSQMVSVQVWALLLTGKPRASPLPVPGALAERRVSNTCFTRLFQGSDGTQEVPDACYSYSLL